MREILVKLSDKFDREGKFDLADKMDELLTTAARPAAPLKNLDDDVKKDLLKFIHKVQTNLKDSMESLDEFFRRLRYFDIGDTVKELKLDKALKELGKIHGCMDMAGKAMYALSYGKHPSKADLAQLAEDLGSEEKPGHNPLEFFDSQHRDYDELSKREEEGLQEYTEKDTEVEHRDYDELSKREEEGLQESTPSDVPPKEYGAFWEHKDHEPEHEDDSEEGDDISEEEYDMFWKSDSDKPEEEEESFEDESEE